MAQMVATTSSLMRGVFLPFILIALLFWNLPTVNHAIGNLLAMTARIQSLEASGVKLAFRDAKTLDLILTAADVKADAIGARIEALPKLTGAHIERLFTIDTPSMVNCVYTKPNMQMGVYLTLDYQLLTWKFLESEPAEGALAEHVKDLDGKESEIGLPSSCHTLKLTATGYDAKTALLKIIRAGFEGTQPGV